MGDNGKTLARQRWQCHDAAYGGQLFAAVTAHDAGLAEQGFDSRIAAGYGSCMRRKYIVTLSLFTVFLVTNMGEATIFSPGGGGGIMWMISAVGGFAIDTYLLYQRQLEQQWAAMGFEMVAPTYERMGEDRSGRKRVVEESREVKRYGV